MRLSERLLISKKKKEKEIITLRVSKEMKDCLEKLSSDYETNVSNLIREIISDYFLSNERNND